MMSKKILTEFGVETESSRKNDVSIEKVHSASLSEWDMIWK